MKTYKSKLNGVFAALACWASMFAIAYFFFRVLSEG